MALQDAHDGLQHIFEKALGAIGRFEAGNFSGWLAAIAHNHTMDYHRKNSYRWQHAVQKTPEEIEGMSGADYGFTQLDIDWEVERILQQVAIHDGDEFSKRELDAILRGVAAGKARHEISNDLDIKMGTLASRLSRLRDRLAESAFTRESLY